MGSGPLVVRPHRAMKRSRQSKWTQYAAADAGRRNISAMLVSCAPARVGEGRSESIGERGRERFWRRGQSVTLFHPWVGGWTRLWQGEACWGEHQGERVRLPALDKQDGVQGACGEICLLLLFSVVIRRDGGVAAWAAAVERRANRRRGRWRATA